MKTTFYKKLVLNTILLASLFISGCSMDTEVYDELTSENFPKTEEQLLRTIAPAYTAIKGYADAVWQANTVSTDECIVATRGSDWNNGGYFRRMYTHTYTPASSANPTATWNFCANGIAQVNQILYQLDNITIDFASKPQKIAELKVIRAFLHYVMLDNYRNIYLSKSFNDTDPPKQVTPKEAFEFIEEEILANIEFLEKNPSSSNYGLMTVPIAKAILAKIYLNANVYTGTPMWEKCLALCNEIVEMDHYQLTPDFMENFIKNNEGSKENIFSIPFDQVYIEGFSHHVYALHYNSGSTYSLSYAPWNGYATLPDHLALFDKEDKRRLIFIEGQQYAADGTALKTRTGDPLVFTEKFNTDDPWNERGTGGVKEAEGVRVLKYVPAAGTGRHMSNDFAVIRYADILLMKAECLVRLGRNNEALDPINMVRKRSLGQKPFVSVSLNDVYEERRREFTWEGMARQDMIRFGKYSGTWTYHPQASSAQKEAFPIPEEVISLNKSLNQNPGY